MSIELEYYCPNIDGAAHTARAEFGAIALKRGGRHRQPVGSACVSVVVDVAAYNYVCFRKLTTLSPQQVPQCLFSNSRVPAVRDMDLPT